MSWRGHWVQKKQWKEEMEYRLKLFKAGCEKHNYTMVTLPFACRTPVEALSECPHRLPERMSGPQFVCVLGCLLFLKPAVFVCYCTLCTMTSKASELWIKPVVHCVGAFSQILKQVTYQLRNNMCSAAAIEFIVGIWKCLSLEELSGFKSDILKLYTVYSDSNALW